jgi:hypothetical protein
MSCPHAETTTLLWIYGEGDESHALHVSMCAECQGVLETHERVQGALRETTNTPTSLPIMDVPKVPASANNMKFGTWLGVSGLVVAAAAVLLAWLGTPNIGGLEQVDDVMEPGTEVAMAQTKVYWDFDGFDEWEDPFEGLEEELASLEEDLSTL